MKRANLFLLLLLGVTLGFSGCSKDDELSPEEKEAKEKEALLTKIDENFDAIISKSWSFKEFQPSDDMTAASKTDDGAVALTTIVKGEQAKNFKMAVSFEKEGEIYNVNVALGVSTERIPQLLLDYQTAILGFSLDFLFETENTYLAEIKRIVAAPLGNDEATKDEISNDETGNIILTIAQNDLSEKEYEDIVLDQKKLITGNNDKIYINEDGYLVVETTSTDYGVSKYIFEAAQ